MHVLSTQKPVWFLTVSPTITDILQKCSLASFITNDLIDRSIYLSLSDQPTRIPMYLPSCVCLSRRMAIIKCRHTSVLGSVGSPFFECVSTCNTFFRNTSQPSPNSCLSVSEGTESVLESPVSHLCPDHPHPLLPHTLHWLLSPVSPNSFPKISTSLDGVGVFESVAIL